LSNFLASKKLSDSIVLGNWSYSEIEACQPSADWTP